MNILCLRVHCRNYIDFKNGKSYLHFIATINLIASLVNSYGYYEEERDLISRGYFKNLPYYSLFAGIIGHLLIYFIFNSDRNKFVKPLIQNPANINIIVHSNQ